MEIYDGRTLHNVRVSYKIDGVLGIFDGKKWIDKEGKPLYNLPVNMYSIKEQGTFDDDLCESIIEKSIKPGRYEIFIANHDYTKAAVSQTMDIPILYSDLYRLDTPLDKCLLMYTSVIDTLNNDLSIIDGFLDTALEDGYEGLVLTADEGEFKITAPVGAKED